MVLRKENPARRELKHHVAPADPVYFFWSITSYKLVFHQGKTLVLIYLWRDLTRWGKEDPLIKKLSENQCFDKLTQTGDTVLKVRD